MSDKFYITTPIFYVNGKPHIGHAFTCIIADVLARYQRNQGADTFLLTGTDEHGAKIAQAAEKAAMSPQAFADEVSQTFVALTEKLNISNNYFIRTTDKEVHLPGVLKLWRTLINSEDLYKGTYTGLYCVGHEAFMKKSDLVDGVCPDHLTAPQELKEENYFFRLSKYTDKLKRMYESGEIVIRPESRRNEVLRMLDESDDVSFSRPRDIVQWGISVPDDDSQLIYVWADALTNYLSAIGYGRNDDWKHYWPADVHLIGKDILRFHAITWPAMLLSVGLDVPKAIYAHGHITVDGQKMSKTIGNVIDPIELVEKYGVDPVRYFLMREIPSAEDGDFSYKKLEDRYNSDLANNLGNLVSRVAKLIETKMEGTLVYDHRFMDEAVAQKIEVTRQEYATHIAEFKLHDALADIWQLFTFANGYIDEHKPWAEPHGDHLLTTLTSVTKLIIESVHMLEPFMPETVAKILAVFGVADKNRQSEVIKFSVTKTEPLFPRI